MRRFVLLIITVIFLTIPVSAIDFTAPAAPDTAEEYMPENTESFGEGLWYILKSAIHKLQPSISEASGICLSLFAITILTSLLHSFSGSTKKVVELAGVFMISLLLMQPANTLIKLGTQTVTELSEYGKLLLPVLTAALAAQGFASSSAALYAATALFGSVLSSAISKLIVPMLYIYLCLCIANSAVGEEVLKNLSKFVKWVITWCLKIILYVFTGYIGITGVVSGTADAAAVKAAKIAISGTIPVVGGIISDASEAILVSAGIMKSTAGVYGLLTVLAVCVGPFLQIGVQFILLKVTAAVSGTIGAKRLCELMQDFSGAMGLILAMTGTVCLLLLISTVCFMKGAA